MAQEIIEGINPTRMELLKLKQREKLAVKGYNLLKEKRNALIMEFFNILERVRGARERVEKKLKEAFEDLTEAQIMMGDMAVNKAAMAVKEFLKVEIDSRNIMGVVVPVVEIEST
ncbi:MAG TPA: V-type ATP synthase subunit D, partial [Methanobacteriales archaeon]|nr:V-type ATP synthase subunit D [Methanobacteriales archaeon]